VAVFVKRGGDPNKGDIGSSDDGTVAINQE
jgi:hypothetical protein